MISDDVRTALKAAACGLHLKRWDTMMIESDIIDGIIRTDWRTYLIGTRSGVLFRTQIDCEDGTDYKVNFLLSEDDLKRGAEILREMEEGEGIEWGESSTPFPVPDLHQFYDLRTTASRAVH